MKSMGLIPLNNNPTRFGLKSTCLDQIFSNYVSQSGVIDVNLSDHIAVYCTRKKIKNSSSMIEFEGRSYRNYVKEDFQENLINSNLNDFYSSQDPNICWDIMENIIRREIDKMCPLQKFKVPERQDPWITNEILEEIRDKDLSLKKARRTNNAGHWSFARAERNRVGKLVDNARANYFKEEEKSSRGNPKSQEKHFIIRYAKSRKYSQK